jgi:hypothetical protein
MHLKEKLYILKNPAFLLLGPSPIEHWFESYQSITVGSLHFYEIAPRSSIVFLRPRSPLLSAARVISAAGHLPSPCRYAPPLSCSTSRPTTPPTARAAPAGRPPLSHVGPPVPSGCHAPEGHAGATRRPEPSIMTALSPSLLRGRALP